MKFSIFKLEEMAEECPRLSSGSPAEMDAESESYKSHPSPLNAKANKRHKIDTKIPRPEKKLFTGHGRKYIPTVSNRSVLQENNRLSVRSVHDASIYKKSEQNRDSSLISKRRVKKQTITSDTTPSRSTGKTHFSPHSPRSMLGKKISIGPRSACNLPRDHKYGDRSGQSVSKKGAEYRSLQSMQVYSKENRKQGVMLPEGRMEQDAAKQWDLGVWGRTRSGRAQSAITSKRWANNGDPEKRISALNKGSNHDQRSDKEPPDRRVTRQITGVRGGTVGNAYTAGIVYGDIGNMYDYRAVHVGSISNQNQFIKVSNNNMTYSQDQIEELLKMACNPFIETTGYTEATSRLDSSGHVTLIGEAGSGKTTIGYRLLKLYKESKHFTPLLVDNVDELKHLQDPNEPTIFFVNDVFGRSSYSASKLQMFLTVFKHLEKVLKPDKNRIIFSSRNYIFRDALPDLIRYQDTFFSDNSVVDLSGGAMLTKSDKEKLLRTFAKRADVTISDENIQKIVEMDTAYGFPHACDMFSKMKKWHTRPLQFFRKPIDVLIESVQHLSHWDKDKFAVLLLIILSDGHFNLAKIRKESDLPEGIRGYISDRRLSEFVSHRHQIAFPLIGSYLSSTGDTLSFRHPTVEDTVAYVIGNMDPLFLINHCSMRVVYERIRIHPSEGTGSTQPTQGDIQWFHIIISDDYHGDLIYRFRSEIGRENFNLVCIHQACSEKIFIEKLFLELEKTNDPITGNLFHKMDRKYRQTFLQWSVMNHSEAFCDKILQTTRFSILEKNNAIITCCVTGNAKALDLLISSLDMTAKQMLTKLRVKKLDMMVLNDSEEISIQKGPVNRYSLLHVACNYGHRDIAAVLVKFGFSVDYDEDYESPLHCCCRKGHVDVLIFLLEHKANLDVKHSYWEETPLHLCCWFNHMAAAQKCVEFGANIEAKDIDGKTPLLNACRRGDKHMVEYLIDSGANKEVKDSTGSTPLIEACIYGNDSIVQCLVLRGVNIETANYSGTSPLIAACQHGHVSIATFLIENGACTNDSSGYLLHSACQGGCVDVAKQLMKSCTPFAQNMQREMKMNFLHSVSIATSDQKEDSKYAIAQLLIKNGADVNALNENNVTPAMLAAESGYWSILNLLIEKGANLYLVDKYGQTIFHKAAKGDIAELICKMLSINRCQEDAPNLMNMADQNKDTPLHVAATFGSVAFLQTFLNSPTDVNALNKYKETPLHSAAKLQNLSVIQVLLCHHADVHSKDIKNRTPLHWAAKYGTVHTVQLFLENKADINAVDHNHQTALHASLKYRRTELAMLLISSGADIHIENKKKQTSLHYAAEYGNCEILEKIISRETDINVKDENNRTALHLATIQPSADNVQMLVSHKPDVNIVDADGMQPLHYAAVWGKADMVQILIENGAAVDGATSDGKQSTSLHLAAKEDKSLYCVYVLLEQRASVNAVDVNGQTPLHIAASRCGAVDTVQLLLDKEANPYALDHNNQTPLHIAANRGDSDIIQAFLDKKLDVDAKDCAHQTPLHIAVSREPDTVTYLLEKEAKFSTKGIGEKSALELILDIVQVLLVKNIANVNALDKMHHTPLHLAILKSRVEIVHLLLKFNADINIADGQKRTPLHLAVLSEHPDIVQMLLDRNIHVNAPNDSEETPLHLAARRRDTSITQLLLNKGADVNVRNADKRTPLHLAAAESSKQIPLLLRSNADIDAKDEKGMTPLHFAALTKIPSSMSALLNHEPTANINATNVLQQTPLHLAAGNGYTQHVEMLLKSKADVQARDEKKRTPLHMAARGKMESLRVVVDTLNVKQVEGNVKKMVKRALSRAHAETCQLLLTFKSDIHAKDETHMTPLHLAAEFGTPDIIQVLLDSGADDKALDDYSNTPLQVAEKNGRVDIIGILLGNKATDDTSKGPLLALPPYYG